MRTAVQERRGAEPHLWVAAGGKQGVVDIDMPLGGGKQNEQNRLIADIRSNNRTCGSQPAANKEWMTSSWPFAEASMRAVRPS